jgi:hypothetical protein
LRHFSLFTFHFDLRHPVDAGAPTRLLQIAIEKSDPNHDEHATTLQASHSKGDPRFFIATHALSHFGTGKPAV